MTDRDGATPWYVEPAYGERSIGDVVPAVARALGVEAGLGASTLELPPAAGYVLLLVDGLGYHQLADHPEEAPYLHSLLGQREPGTAGVPSTTATSLTSLGTALVPGRHGLVGFTSRVPGTNHLLNALQWSRKVDPYDWQPHTTAFARLAAAGVRTTVVNKREFAQSGLTLAGHRGAEFVGADRVGERLAAAMHLARARPSLTYLYDGDLDWTGHRHGVASDEWKQQLSITDATVEHLREELPAHCRILVLADHGMVDGPPEHRVDVDAYPELRTGVDLVGGEARFRHLYCRSGAVEDVLATWRGHLGSRAEVLSRAEAVERGWFGPLDPQVGPRLGDVVVACRDDHAVVSTVDFAYEAQLVGLHGSLTPEEMLIPLLVA